MPAAMHSFYLRQMYQENRLSRGKIKLLGTKIDLTKVKVPVFILSTREDHIAPWKSTYAATQLYSGPTTFCLAASGHIAGVVNPPAAGKYCHWTNDKLPRKPDQWLETAVQHPGSWWPRWDEWAKGHAGETVPARSPGDGGLKAIEAAPGSYVKVKAQ
jgi:polyhydroxyalkanoate synthase